MLNRNILRPLLKWAGGKRSLVEHIVSLFPHDFKGKSYHEPFFGGGAVFFHIEPKSGSINDINSKLINFYSVVRDNPIGLIEKAQEYRYNNEEYYVHRARFNTPGLSDLEYAALLLYLNKTAYNGLYRVNSNGEFNVPIGRFKDPVIVKPRSIIRASKLLQKVDIRCEEFNYILNVVEEGDLCYLDPPYYPTSETANFTDYSTEGFDIVDQERLRDLCLELESMGVSFVLSNSNTKVINELYGRQGFKIKPITTKRMISSKVSSRNLGNDLLITNISKN